MQVEDPPALTAAQSHGVLQHVQLSYRHRAGMFDDASAEYRRRLFTGRTDRIIRRIHHDRNPRNDLVDGNMVGHPAGTAREDEIGVIFKPLESDAERMHRETLLDKGSAAKHLCHGNQLWDERRGRACPFSLDAFGYRCRCNDETALDSENLTRRNSKGRCSHPPDPGAALQHPVLQFRQRQHD